MLYPDKIYITLAYPCILLCSCYIFSFAMITLGGSRWRKFWEQAWWQQWCSLGDMFACLSGVFYGPSAHCNFSLQEFFCLSVNLVVSVLAMAWLYAQKALQVHSWMTVTVGFLMYVVPNLTALYYDCVMFYLVNFIYSNRMLQKEQILIFLRGNLKEKVNFLNYV